MITLPEVKNIIAIASGKGGVGKSTTAVNLALALHLENKNVGILDADIYGPSQPMMLGVQESKPQSHDDQFIEPIRQYGLQTMSMGYFIEADTPMVWRGPMVSTALQQLLQNTRWQNLDYLIIDLPPGTGDVQLTLSQKIPLTAALIVTTPQDIALIDAKKAAAMFDKVHVPVLGIIENMSMHICRQCGHHEAIFGTEGGAKLAEKLQIELLGQLPLDSHIREATDKGKPSVASDPESAITQIYREIAKEVIEKVSRQQRLKSKLPRIKIESS